MKHAFRNVGSKCRFLKSNSEIYGTLMFEEKFDHVHHSFVGLLIKRLLDKASFYFLRRFLEGLLYAIQYK